MLNFALFICSALSLGVAYFAMFKPLFLDQQAAYFQPVAEEEEFDESISLLETIDELESDFKMGKLSKDDFESLSLEFKRLYLEKKTKKET